jgi:hypothetical protein
MHSLYDATFGKKMQAPRVTSSWFTRLPCFLKPDLQGHTQRPHLHP